VQLGYSDQERAFQGEVLAFLEDWRGLDQYLHGEDFDRLRAFYQALGARNWLSLGWPIEDGGQGLPPIFEFLLWDEMAYARVARPPLSAGIVAKTMIRFGTRAQKARWLEPIRTGQLMFSLGYSEPGAGSDLAGLRTRAELRDGKYIVNGSKIWSSAAQEADYLWLLCRTGEVDSRAAGLSLLIVDLKSPNLRIRPMAKMSGNIFCEIFFDDVEVPEDQRIGPENGAWKMMNASLADERHVQFPPKRVLADYESVRDWALTQGLDRDPVVREKLAELAVGVLECQAHAFRVLTANHDPVLASVAAAANKRACTDAIQAIARAAMDFGAPMALTQDAPTHLLWRQTTEESLGGGTTEIMTSIVARAGLGLKA